MKNRLFLAATATLVVSATVFAASTTRKPGSLQDGQNMIYSVCKKSFSEAIKSINETLAEDPV